eukprot:CAMPEP_0182878426 /NCGR_PEP_ID=MMETSP0034_2-20130328/15347_1 /TAXON_ID=156128 /ORGANISM="Nephroselmis pyriformis, Strain CCMP717" /LENGTH=306 /DNA_ID=CAMNT_0025011309 /DNA_START=123 /DNA_END=1043 /DNA_ORIENTATION=-
MSDADAKKTQQLEELRKKLTDPATSLPQLYRVLFSLKNVPGTFSREAMIAALDNPSALFRHEVAFCLGQMQDTEAVPVLKAILQNTEENGMVRHEAGEALGAIAQMMEDPTEVVEALKAHAEDEVLEVAETCLLAMRRVEHYRAASSLEGEEKKKYLSVDPTPALPSSTPTEELRATLLDEAAHLFQRYGAMFALRNQGGAAAAEALGEAFKARSALLKHEVAYVLGQMQDSGTIDVLEGVLADASQHCMVRHEAAEALGAIASEHCLQLLRDFAKDPDAVVADSCVVALDMLEHEQSGAFEYCEV